MDGVLEADYTYDANGNRLAKATPSGTEIGIYDAQDRLITYGDGSYIFDDAGYLQTRTTPEGITTYDYDVMGNLRSATLADGRQIEYEIDGANRRVGKKVDGAVVQRFLYRGILNPVVELDASNNVVATFIYGTKINVPDYMVKGPDTYRIISDHLGTVRLVVNVADGTLAQRLDYDEFGVVTLDTNPGFQPFGFAGGLYDADVGLVRFGARDYDAETGRWTAKDPILFRSGRANVYAYAAQDPINRVDPSGRYTEVVIWDPAGYGKSSFGHVSVDVNGMSVSWGPEGLGHEPFSDYSQRNSFRDGHGYILNLTPEQEQRFLDCLGNQGGSYDSLNNNCVHPVEHCLRELGFDFGGRVLPSGLGEDLSQSDLVIGETAIVGSEANPDYTAPPWSQL